ncbi:MAG TPA: thioredoxin-like domain-containing protein [Candidatus Acidoferrales bacterium]|nr:thioredoxin-like domain-containing protein [Candidatus Acidoferrales bacterium]
MFKLAALTLFAAITSLQPVLTWKDWIGDRVHEAELAGKVVILDVFTVDCYNCRNVVPTLRSLYAADHAKGLEIVGIHSPETPAEKQRAYVVENLRQQGIVWPVAVDNAFDLWNAYGVNAWPTQLFFDRHGRLQKVIVGDSQDDLVRSTTEALLAEH